jgi:predicted PurR-regulated permease PerM
LSTTTALKQCVKHLNQNKMRDFVIHYISLVFMLMICFIINFLFENKELTLAITFMLGYFTYPLIKYLQEKPKSE